MLYMYIHLSSSSEYNCFASCQQRALMDLMKARGDGWKGRRTNVGKFEIL